MRVVVTTVLDKVAQDVDWPRSVVASKGLPVISRAALTALVLVATLVLVASLAQSGRDRGREKRVTDHLTYPKPIVQGEDADGTDRAGIEPRVALERTAVGAVAWIRMLGILLPVQHHGALIDPHQQQASCGQVERRRILPRVRVVAREASAADL